VYDNLKEIIPPDPPILVDTSDVAYCHPDACPHHDILISKSVTIKLHVMNKAPGDLIIVNPTSYESEVAADHSDIAIPVQVKSFIFADHCVHEAVTSSMIVLTCVPGATHQADILSKYWGCEDVWFKVKILFKQDVIAVEGFSWRFILSKVLSSFCSIESVPLSVLL
jgi:hypothetical protein